MSYVNSGTIIGFVGADWSNFTALRACRATSGATTVRSSPFSNRRGQGRSQALWSVA
jgi:hypothetical protein